MKVRCKKPWRYFKKGHVFEMPDGVAGVWIRRGFLEKVRKPGRPRKNDGQSK